MHKVSLIHIISPLGTLYQSHQITKKDNKRRERNFPNLSETVEGNETYLAAAVRGVKEELGLSLPNDRFSYVKQWEEIKPSPTTNKLKEYEFYLYKLELTLEEANACTLQVEEGDCYTYFEWRV